MAEQRGKGGGARKYGRKKRKPSHAGQMPRTVANKLRKAQTLAHSFEAAERRRASDSYIDPTTGKKARRGTKAEVAAVAGRVIQSAKVEAKRNQRKNFSKLTPKQKATARVLGLPSRTMH
jgi:hypothetical protein